MSLWKPHRNGLSACSASYDTFRTAARLRFCFASYSLFSDLFLSIFQNILCVSRLAGSEDIQLHRQRRTEQRLPLQRLQVQEEGKKLSPLQPWRTSGWSPTAHPESSSQWWDVAWAYGDWVVLEQGTGCVCSQQITLWMASMCEQKSIFLYLWFIGRSYFQTTEKKQKNKKNLNVFLSPSVMAILLT